jgi:hypothetical protein
LPQDNILNLTAQTTQDVADGRWLFLKPLPPGKYELKVKGEIEKVSAKELGGNEYNGQLDGIKPPHMSCGLNSILLRSFLLQLCAIFF